MCTSDHLRLELNDWFWGCSCVQVTIHHPQSVYQRCVRSRYEVTGPDRVRRLTCIDALVENTSSDTRSRWEKRSSCIRSLKARRIFKQNVGQRLGSFQRPTTPQSKIYSRWRHLHKTVLAMVNSVNMLLFIYKEEQLAQIEEVAVYFVLTKTFDDCTISQNDTARVRIFFSARHTKKRRRWRNLNASLHTNKSCIRIIFSCVDTQHNSTPEERQLHRSRIINPWNCWSHPWTEKQNIE